MERKWKEWQPLADGTLGSHHSDGWSFGRFVAGMNKTRTKYPLGREGDKGTSRCSVNMEDSNRDIQRKETGNR